MCHRCFVSAASVEARSVPGRDPSPVARDPRLPAVVVREQLAPLGFDGAQTIVNAYVREVRPQTCVPTVALKGDSYRLKDRDLARPSPD
jgi:hypothetical protein